MKDTYTRAEVIAIIHELLQYPDQLADATHNEQTDWDAKALLDLIEQV